MTFLELEKECKKRKRLKFLIVFLVLLIIGGIFLYFYKYQSYNKNKINNSIKLSAKIIKKEIKQDINKTKKLDKSISFKKFLVPIIDLNISETKDIKTDFIKEKNITKKITNNLIIKSKIIPSFESCISLADTYYKNKEYQKALKWAKLANIQNKKDKRSWIISAKSLYKLGNKEKAIEILSIYYKFNPLKEIKELIENIKKGKI